MNQETSAAVSEMPISRYAPPSGRVEIDNQQVLLVWGRSDVLVFKDLDVNNPELIVCK